MPDFSFYTNIKTHIIYDVRSHTNLQTNIICDTGKTIDKIIPHLNFNQTPSKIVQQVLNAVYRTVIHPDYVTTTLAEAHYHLDKAAIKVTLEYKGSENIFLNNKIISGTGIGMGDYAGKIYLVKIIPQKNIDGNILGYKHLFIDKK
jgi:hypothetical protein